MESNQDSSNVASVIELIKVWDNFSDIGQMSLLFHWKISTKAFLTHAQSENRPAIEIIWEFVLLWVAVLQFN